jgi:drug/metabolite transporter (DMT)-like permease
MPINVVLLVGTSLAWAAGYVFIREVDSALPPVASSAVMAAVASVVMIVAVLALRRPLMQPLRTRWWLPVIMAFSAVAIPNISVVQAELTVHAELAAVLGTTVPILTFLLTTFVTRQTAFSVLRLLGVAISVVGLVIFVGWRNLVSDDLEVIGMLTMMSGGVVFAINGIVLGSRTADIDKYALATWTMIFATVALAAFSFFMEDTPSWPRQDVLISLVGEGAIGMGLAYLGYFVLVARAGADFGSLYAFLVPPFGVIAAAIVFGQNLTIDHVVGLATILFGLMLITRRTATA